MRSFRGKKWKYICNNCGGENIQFDGYARLTWNKNNQSWVSSELEYSDNGDEYCEDCEEYCGAEEILMKKKKLYNNEECK